MAYTFDFPGYSTITLTKSESGTPGNYPEKNELLISGENLGGNLISLMNTAAKERLAAISLRDGLTKQELGAFGLRTGSIAKRCVYIEASAVDEPDKTTATAPPVVIIQTSSYFGEESYNGRDRLLFDEDGTLFLNDRLGAPFLVFSKTGRKLTLTPASIESSAPITFIDGASTGGAAITLGNGTPGAARVQFLTAAYSGGFGTKNGADFLIRTNGQQSAFWDNDGNLLNRGNVTAQQITGTSVIAATTGNAAIILQSSIAGNGSKVLIEHTIANQLRFSMFNGTMWIQPISFDAQGRSTWSKVAQFTPQPTPDNPSEGMIYADSTDHHLKFYNGGEWRTLDQ